MSKFKIIYSDNSEEVINAERLYTSDGFARFVSGSGYYGEPKVIKCVPHSRIKSIEQLSD